MKLKSPTISSDKYYIFKKTNAPTYIIYTVKLFNTGSQISVDPTAMHCGLKIYQFREV